MSNIIGATLAIFMVACSFGQPPLAPRPDGALAPSDEGVSTRGSTGKSNDKRLFGLIPNARSSPSLDHYQPITAREKFKIAKDDSFDRGTMFLGVLVGAESQLRNASPAFGHGGQAFGKYVGSAYADFVTGNMMTEGIYPALLHQDPRYFRRGTGTKWSRLGFSVKQIVWTHQDSGRQAVNYSEVLGNATAVAISNAYYPDNRNVGDAVSKLGIQIAFDVASNVLKEFGPDISRRFMRKRNNK